MSSNRSKDSSSSLGNFKFFQLKSFFTFLVDFFFNKLHTLAF